MPETRCLDLLEADFRHAGEPGWQDMAVAHLKILLIIATRLKRREIEAAQDERPAAAQPMMNRLRELIEAHFREWHRANNTYGFAYGLGALLCVMGLLLVLDGFNPLLGLLGGLLVFIMSIGTLSFLITTPETWVPALGDKHHGFPYLSAAGRLVLKDFIMMGGSVVIVADSARRALARCQR